MNKEVVCTCNVLKVFQSENGTVHVVLYLRSVFNFAANEFRLSQRLLTELHKL